MKLEYEKQVALLVKCIPFISEIDCFALKGGTAINLFYRNLPRLSVDIDLAYIHLNNRNEAIKEINDSLKLISLRMKSNGILSQIQNNNGIQKLICFDNDTTIKIEPNYTNRGVCLPLELKQTSDKVQELFGFAEIKVLSKPELFGGKICAALDRQHPRDLFDVYLMLKNQEIDNEIKDGFLLELLCHNRNIYEILNPQAKDQKEIFKTQFNQMTDIPFTYEDHQNTFKKLVSLINKKLTSEDKKMLLNFTKLEKFSFNSSYKNIENLSAIKWKVKNLVTLKENNKQKYDELITKTEIVLFNSQTKSSPSQKSKADDDGISGRA